ncbi:TMEM175 family protein [Streptomyces sp. NRRL S-118]|uniref:TMEM175 family protein n=1 Tax=Streptomyces sp. NRRL S-118 TaxID=1463881 RepID=UPI000AA45DBE|nr:TMEM175 family protein [Streptomyces sp. NRRL S-118]
MPTHRMLALTDGVVAIAMTLLVLDIELPDGLRGNALRHALDDVQSQVGTFLLSAIVIALFWRAHHAALRDAERVDGRLFWLNVAFLVLVSLIPFPTRVLESYAHRPLGPGLYGAVIGAAALLLYAMELHVLRSTRHLSWRSVPLPAQAVVFLLSAVVAVYSPTAAIYSWIASVPLAMLAHRLAARPSPKERDSARQGP